MRFEFKPSFERSIKALPVKDKAAVVQTAIQAIDILSKKQDYAVGIGFKRLHKNFWEVRYGIKIRIVFRWDGDFVEFILAGSHDQISRFLKEL
jgi:hypothetical protein